MLAVAEALGALAPRDPPPVAPATKPGKTRLKLLGKRAEQTNLCVAWRGVQTQHPDKYAIDMLNAVLGEGMSSRLFLELREKRGLAYDVHSYDANYADAGHIVVYAGFAPTPSHTPTPRHRGGRKLTSNNAWPAGAVTPRRPTRPP